MDIPNHIVIFPDGNGRWAKKHMLPAVFGYQKGYKNLLDLTRWCQNANVKILTVFGFTTENWDRGSKITNLLMKILEKKLSENVKKYIKNGEWDKIGVRIRVLGQKEKLPTAIQETIRKMEEATERNSKIFLNLCISYGGKWDILEAVKKIIKDGVLPDKIDEKLFESYLSTSGIPSPDFIIRAGGNMRLSNFALWQSAYSELYFSKKCWPEFTKQDFDEALKEFGNRQRRVFK